MAMEVMERTDMVEELTDREMEVVMTVFRSYETGLREATIYSKVINIHNILLFETWLPGPVPQPLF